MQTPPAVLAPELRQLRGFLLAAGPLLGMAFLVHAVLWRAAIAHPYHPAVKCLPLLYWSIAALLCIAEVSRPWDAAIERAWLRVVAVWREAFGPEPLVVVEPPPPAPLTDAERTAQYTSRKVAEIWERDLERLARWRADERQARLSPRPRVLAAAPVAVANVTPLPADPTIRRVNGIDYKLRADPTPLPEPLLIAPTEVIDASEYDDDGVTDWRDEQWVRELPKQPAQLSAPRGRGRPPKYASDEERKAAKAQQRAARKATTTVGACNVKVIE